MFSALGGVFHVMRYINVRYLLLLTYPGRLNLANHSRTCAVSTIISSIRQRRGECEERIQRAWLKLAQK